MHYSVLVVSFAVLAVAAPMESADMQKMKSLKDMEAVNKMDTANNMDTMNDMNSMEDTKQATDSAYSNYGVYGKYDTYGTYPTQVEATAEMMAEKNMKRDMKASSQTNDMMLKEWRQKMTALKPEELASMKHALMAMNERQAADTSYGQYGLYGKYTDYGDYPGDVETEAEKMQMAQ